MYQTYFILNKINTKIYVGITRRNLELRFREHLDAAEDETHFHRAIRCHGEENFYITLIDRELSKKSADSLERHYISFFRLLFGKDNVYNTAPGGEGGSGPRTEEQKARMRKPHGPMPEKQKAKQRKPLLKRGHKPSCQCCMCQARRREPLSKKKLEAVRLGHTKRVYTEEILAEMSRTRKGIKRGPRPKEWNEKNKLAQTGRKMINNGSFSKWSSITDLPKFLSEGWILGMLKSKITEVKK